MRLPNAQPSMFLIRIIAYYCPIFSVHNISYRSVPRASSLQTLHFWHILAQHQSSTCADFIVEYFSLACSNMTFYLRSQCGFCANFNMFDSICIKRTSSPIRPDNPAGNLLRMKASIASTSVACVSMVCKTNVDREVWEPTVESSWIIAPAAERST